MPIATNSWQTEIKHIKFFSSLVMKFYRYIYTFSEYRSFWMVYVLNLACARPCQFRWAKKASEQPKTPSVWFLLLWIKLLMPTVVLVDKHLAIARNIPHAKHPQCLVLGNSFPESQKHLTLKSRQMLNFNLKNTLLGMLPLVSQSPYPIIVYFLPNYRPHLGHLLENVIFTIPT